MYEPDDGTALRIATYANDGADLVRLLAGMRWSEDALQQIGDGLLVALRQNTDGAGELASRCAAQLRVRAWEGDEELADALQPRSDAGQVPRKPLHVDLEDLAMVLEGDPAQGGGRIDLTTGEVWPQAVFDDGGFEGLDEDDEDPDRWLYVHCEGSRSAYRDMEWFISELDDSDVAERLDIAISGRGAFRRFKDTVADWPDLRARWFTFSGDRQRGRARAWLFAEGYIANPPFHE